MSMYHVNLLADENTSEKRYRSEELWQRGVSRVRRYGVYGYVVHFQARSEVAHTNAIWSVAMGDNNNLVIEISWLWMN
jgi:hypothetical protein